ncbi:hypothetical protein [Sorangium sp. So ce128]|uniref:hypothetical protein n=1 Tax=Sorangium sp. So ce128 TaxID=3133281 RepID=UPI003F5FAA49
MHLDGAGLLVHRLEGDAEAADGVERVALGVDAADDLLGSGVDALFAALHRRSAASRQEARGGNSSERKAEVKFRDGTHDN